MSAPLFDVETVIDERTKDELQPPCEAQFTDTGLSCPNPAKWIVRVACPTHGTKVALYCPTSLQLAVVGRMWCIHCLPEHWVARSLLSVEPLR